jgi:hypothetical protein
MTPQEQELIKGLFDRLSQLESQPRDPEAARFIAQGLTSAPHAIYPLVQTVLLQDEALKRANARIEELQAQTSAAAEPEQPQTSFLDSMREALGGRAPHGSVPSVRTAGGQQPQPGAPGFGSGGSFLGTGASTAAGVIGGSLLLDGIRSMFGHQLGGTYADREQDRQQDWRMTANGNWRRPTASRTANRIWRTTANRNWRTSTANRTPNKIWPTKTLNKTANKT